MIDGVIICAIAGWGRRFIYMTRDMTTIRRKLNSWVIYWATHRFFSERLRIKEFFIPLEQLLKILIKNIYFGNVFFIFLIHIFYLYNFVDILINFVDISNKSSNSVDEN